MRVTGSFSEPVILFVGAAALFGVGLSILASGNQMLGGLVCAISGTFFAFAWEENHA
jgi:hypothetical protein